MKYLLFLCIIACSSQAAFGQDTINPYNTQQSMTIELHNTDVYYCPMAPPGPMDTGWKLSSLSDMLRDSDALFDKWPHYEPWVYDPIHHHDTELQYLAPCGGAQLGYGGQWQRFFTAKRDGSGNTHDIIAGGDTGDRVIISKNEDVDFRASGRIKLKNGFRAMAGCRFHAYTEPKYDSVVFSDDFDSTAIDRNKWYVANGNSDGFGIQSHCSTTDDVADTLDPDAIDGHALDIFLRENRDVGGVLDTCHCLPLAYSDHDSCDGTLPPPLTLDTSALFYCADVRACPFPYLRRDTLPLVPMNQQIPYGKYEIRKKIPHLAHHTNDWPDGSFEVDINESNGDTILQGYLFPNFHQNVRYGPFKGVFHKTWSGINRGYGLIDSVIFVSHGAQWSNVNAPHVLLINNFPYEVARDWNLGDQHDTVRMDPRTFGYMGWPASLANDTTDSVTFYYERYGGNTADTTTWTVDGSGRKFYAPYRDSLGTWLRFSKAYQPTEVTLRDSITLGGDTISDSYNCHWEYNLNPPSGTGDSGILYLDNPMSPTKSHTNTEAYVYSIDEGDFAAPAVPFDMYDTTGDYTYHTFAVEILPHEMRYLYDSNVVLRLPDRMIPSWSREYNFNLDRGPMDFVLGEFDLSSGDPLAADTTSELYEQKKYFETHPYNPGFRDVTIGGHTYHAAHELIDYVRVWDVPKDVSVPNFPK